MCIFLNRGLKAFFLIAINVITSASDSSNFCQNGGVLKKINNKSTCFCEGLAYYGEFCQIPCHIENFEFIVPEKCLSGECGIPKPCIDVKLPMIINRNLINRTLYPICRTPAPICMNHQDNFFVNRTLHETKTEFCKNGGILKTLSPTSACLCKGTRHYGDFCEVPCTNLGYEIPEKCLNGPCDLPASCVDLSRPNVHINRCKNGVFVVGKEKNSCACAGSGFWGPYCERPCLLEAPGYCRNNTCDNLYPVDCIF